MLVLVFHQQKQSLSADNAFAVIAPAVTFQPLCHPAYKLVHAPISSHNHALHCMYVTLQIWTLEAAVKPLYSRHQQLAHIQMVNCFLNYIHTFPHMSTPVTTPYLYSQNVL